MKKIFMVVSVCLYGMDSKKIDFKQAFATNEHVRRFFANARLGFKFEERLESCCRLQYYQSDFYVLEEALRARGLPFLEAMTYEDMMREFESKNVEIGLKKIREGLSHMQKHNLMSSDQLRITCDSLIKAIFKH